MGDAMKFVKSLYVQILFAVLLGVLVGHFWSQQAIALKPLGDAFIKLIKMMIAPVVFCTIVTGIAGTGAFLTGSIFIAIVPPVAMNCTTGLFCANAGRAARKSRLIAVFLNLFILSLAPLFLICLWFNHRQ